MSVLKNTIKLIGDRLLIKANETSVSSGGIIIPDTAKEDAETSCGIIVRVGPGFLSHQKSEDKESWLKEETPESHYVPLQVKEGHKIVYFKKMAVELTIDGCSYYVIPQSAVLVYDENPFDI